MSAKVISLAFSNRAQAAVVTDQNEGKAVSNELRRARIRIAQLEASLSEAMRDSLANFNRAREAERHLEKMQG